MKDAEQDYAAQAMSDPGLQDHPEEFMRRFLRQLIAKGDGEVTAAAL